MARFTDRDAASKNRSILLPPLKEEMRIQNNLMTPTNKAEVASPNLSANNDADESAAQAKRLFERRLEIRYPTNDLVEVKILDKEESSRVAGRALDVSRSGMRIETKISLAKGTRVQIIVPRRLAVSGEIRYCRRVGEMYQQGILIENVIHAHPLRGAHIADDILSLYLVEKGLTVPEIIGLQEHLMECAACRSRLAVANEILNPVRRRKSLTAEIDDEPSHDKP